MRISAFLPKARRETRGRGATPLACAETLIEWRRYEIAGRGVFTGFCLAFGSCRAGARAADGGYFRGLFVLARESSNSRVQQLQLDRRQRVGGLQRLRMAERGGGFRPLSQHKPSRAQRA